MRVTRSPSGHTRPRRRHSDGRFRIAIEEDIADDAQVGSPRGRGAVRGVALPTPPSRVPVETSPKCGRAAAGDPVFVSAQTSGRRQGGTCKRAVSRTAGRVRVQLVGDAAQVLASYPGASRTSSGDRGPTAVLRGSPGTCAMVRGSQGSLVGYGAPGDNRSETEMEGEYFWTWVVRSRCLGAVRRLGPAGARRKGPLNGVPGFVS
jgi:hypothetical protein